MLPSILSGMARSSALRTNSITEIRSRTTSPTRPEDSTQQALEAQFPARSLIAALAILVVAYTLYIIVVGGDHFPGGRFFVPLLAPMILLAQESVRRTLLSLRLRPLRWTSAVLLTIGLGAYAITAVREQEAHGPLALRTNRDTSFVNIWGSAGLWLRDHTAPGTLAASPVAGAIAYYSQRPVVDMLGLNDLHVGHRQISTMGSGLAGHEKQDPDYVLGRRPEYILPYPNYFVPIEDQFAASYITTTVRSPLGYEIAWWKRNDVEP